MSELIDGMRRTLDQFCLKKRVVYFPGSPLLLKRKPQAIDYKKSAPLEARRATHLRKHRRWVKGWSSERYHIPSMRPYFGYVYFVQENSKKGLIKIGFSKRLGSRLYEQGLLNEEYTFLGKMRGLPSDEKVIHKMFWQFREANNSNRHSTEWFYPVKPILFFIKYFCETPKGRA